MDYFNNCPNDLDENIMNFEIGKDEVNIQTEFSINLDFTSKSINIIRQANRYVQLKFVGKKLTQDSFIDTINFNYITGFYCVNFEGLDVDDFLHNCDFYCIDDEYIQIDFQMEYTMNRQEIEYIFKDYKRCD